MRRIGTKKLVGRWTVGLAVAGVTLVPGRLMGVALAPRGDVRRVNVRGHVVDDETGRPIEAFGVQPRQDASRDPTRATWSDSIRIVPGSHTRKGGKRAYAPNPGGEFDYSISYREDPDGPTDGLRILADGYEPTPVETISLAPLDRFDAGMTFDMVIRMKRGRAVVGRVVDHLGRPAAGAKLYLLRPDSGRVTIHEDVIGEGSDQGLLDPSLTRATADADGRFRLDGVDEAGAIGVSAPTFHHCIVPLPAPGHEAAISLPEPATLRIRVDLEGDPPEVKFDLYSMEAAEASARVAVRRSFTIANPGEIVVRNATPGRFRIDRRKVIAGSAEPQDYSVEARFMTIEAGQAHDADYVRDQGRPVVGRVRLPDGERPRVLYVGIEPVITGPRGGRIPSAPPLLDIVACDLEGNFRTARIPPGRYTARVDGHLVRARYGPFHMMNGPDFEGEQTLTVPADGEPPAPATIIEARRKHWTTVPILKDAVGGP
ncbi:carboxypeptidase-like regulatory domain-containing protein [Tundrisphaera sp. TA3]|uniref:carboxypeptidase-like regulatory domain-containing protein n=1 Tax=Tundrisphaera sp. TA3 TaxID=3435775 RepID=UPI003EBAE604